jgi:hypothetical protein
MKGSWKRLVMVCPALIILAGGVQPAHAQDSSSEDIEVRWVMAGLTKNADPSEPISISPEARMNSGDRIKMYLSTRSKCFFYLFHQTPEGELHLLFPATLPSQGLPGGTRITVPQGAQWFELDEQTGTETFHVLVSPTPLDTIETLYQDYLQHTDRNGSTLALLLSAFEQLRHQQRPLTSKAERPLSIGGTIRGASEPKAEPTGVQLDRLAEDIETRSVFCRTYTIEHH